MKSLLLIPGLLLLTLAAQSQAQGIPSSIGNNQVSVGTGTNAYTAKTVPDCTDTTGNHLNFTQSTNAFSCGTSSSGTGTVTSVGFTGGLISVGTATTTPAFTVAGTSGGIPYFSAASTWASSAALASGGLVLGGGAGATPATNTGLTFSSPTLTVGLAGTSSGILALTGSTSGSATFTAPATAGTTTNAVASSNIISGPTITGCTFCLAGQTNTGFGDDATVWGQNTPTVWYGSASRGLVVNQGNGIAIPQAGRVIWASAINSNAAADLGISRSAAGVLAVGNGNAASTTGRVKASGYMSVGTKFATDTGCGTVTSTAGGATAGVFTAQATGACTVVVTMGDTATAPNGWDCTVNDRTTANLFRTSASSTTTATLTGTAVTGDVVSFHCIGY